MARHALSNLLGGITHFYGQPVMESVPDGPIVYAEERELVTAVPSRSFFPR